MNSLNRVKDTDILAKVKPTKTGNSLTSSGVRGRDVSQNDMILKAHKPGSIRSNASDTKTLPQQSLCKKMDSSRKGFDERQARRKFSTRSEQIKEETATTEPIDHRGHTASVVLIKFNIRYDIFH